MLRFRPSTPITIITAKLKQKSPRKRALEIDAIPRPDLDRVRCRGGCANRLTTGPWHKGLYNLVQSQAWFENATEHSAEGRSLA